MSVQDTNSDDTSTELEVTEATVLQKVLDVTEDASEFEVLEYEVEEMQHRRTRVIVRVEMAVRQYDSFGLEELTDDEDDIEVRVNGKGGGRPFAAIGVSGEYKDR